MGWRELEAEELERQFNPRHAVPDFEKAQLRRAAVNETTRRSRRAFLDVRYGGGPLHRVDIFPAESAGAPIQLFLHGGYWRAQDKANFAFVAELLVPAGICAVIVNYDLCPAVTLDGVVDSALSAIAWSYAHAHEYGADPERLTLSGNSAGAHLIAMALLADWSRFGLPAPPVKGALAISGIYDPEPAMRISVNDDLRLTPEVVARNNALAHPPRRICPIELYAGGDEPPLWIAQTELYARHLARHGVEPAVTVVPGAHHFSIMDGFLDPASALAQSALRIGRC